MFPSGPHHPARKVMHPQRASASIPSDTSDPRGHHENRRSHRPMAPHHTLRALADHLRTGAPLQPDERDILADALDAYLDGAVPLDRALGLRKWGGVSPARAAALADRDGMIRRLWRSSPDWVALDPAAAARVMRLSASRYEQVRWPRERDHLSAPSAEPAATWWRVFQTYGRVPGAKRLQQILEAEIQEGV